MKILLKPHVVRKIERMAGQKMTTRCSSVVDKALDNAIKNGVAIERLSKNSSYYKQVTKEILK